MSHVGFRLAVGYHGWFREYDLQPDIVSNDILVSESPFYMILREERYVLGFEDQSLVI